MRWRARVPAETRIRSSIHMMRNATPVADTPRHRWLETVGVIGMFGFVAAVQFSILAGQTLVWLTVLAWLGNALVKALDQALDAEAWLGPPLPA